MAEKAALKLLLIGVSELVAQITTRIVGPDESKRIDSSDDFMAFLESPDAATYPIIVCGPMITDMQTVELGQALSGTLKGAAVFYCHDSRDGGYDRTLLIKNGFSEAYLLPLDKDTFCRDLDTLVVKIREMPAFRSVRVSDVDEGTVLDFDLFVLLAHNKKYVRYASAGQTLESCRVDKLKTHNVGAVFVPLDQMPQFYNYAAEKLKKAGAPAGALSETEKRERLQESVRNLVSGLFATTGELSFEDGKKVMGEAIRIVRSFLDGCGKEDLQNRMTGILGELGSTYSHLTNVSSFAALFSIATGVGNPEELAIAGLFHEIGVSMVPAALMEKDPSTWTPDERKIYEKHPEHSVNMLKEKKINLPPSVQTMILQHHERAGGKGFPLALSEPKLKPESQILALADEFDELMKFEIGKQMLSPEQALERIKASGLFNLDILNILLKTFKVAA